MSDNPLDGIPSHDRVSLRAVVVSDSEDPEPSLVAAGISDPIALPIVFGEGQPDVGFGDGVTPNLTAVLEPGQEQDGGFPPGGQSTEADAPGPVGGLAAGRAREAAADPGRVTTSLPPAFGMQPLAPVRRGGRRGRT